jgi:hypothetical protein
MNHNSQNPTDKFVRDFEAHISAPRFKRYYRIYPVTDSRNPKERDKIDAIAIYMWNTALCEALYPSLQTLEIVFRNAVHSALVVETGSSKWYEDSRHLLLASEQNRVTKAMDELERSRKPLDPPRIVAELMFGFWVSIYSDPYLEKIVHPTIKSVFPNLSPKLRSHRYVQKRLQQARNLRNRVFHHEPIWHWPELPKQHDEILETIEWISRPHRKLCLELDRFSAVYAAGWKPYRDKLDWLFALEEEVATRFSPDSPEV